MTRPLEVIYNFYLCLVYQFIEFWGAYKENENGKFRYRDLEAFSKRILKEMKTSSDDWKRIMNYYEVYSKSAVDEHTHCRLSSICNTTVLMFHGIVQSLLQAVLEDDLDGSQKVITRTHAQHAQMLELPWTCWCSTRTGF